MLNPFRTLARLFDTTPRPDPDRTSRQGERLTAKELEALKEDRCPDCGHAEGFQAGPSGGLSQNFRCPGCGAGFNAMGPFGVERITDRKFGQA
jgi:predicted RNA-binding Zn-ribbon protein involved in translation (DUF1610 family)